MTSTFKIELYGLKQGDPLSPVLYNFAINPLLSQLQQKLTGISISGQASLKTLAFADDCVLGLSSNQDATIANDLISKYESV